MVKLILTLLLIASPAVAQEYLVLSSTNQAYARGLSERLWRLHSPNAATDPKIVTKSWVGYIVNTNDGRVALGPIVNATLKVHPNANTDELADYVAAAVTGPERAKIKPDVGENKGKAVSVKLLTPQSRALNWRTKEQLQAEEGWGL